ncbi:MAG: choice-of-anchor J domain-containing protein [Ferruginibacter sp.]
MIKQISSIFFGVIIIATASFTSCQKEAKVSAKPNYSVSEEFDTVSTSVAKGWVIKNNSLPLGTLSWGQANFYLSYYNGKADDYIFGGGFGYNNPSFSGNNFIMCTSDCGAGIANCSCWLISPEITAKNGDEFSFYTRTYENPASAPDRLEVRLNAVNSSTNVGTDTSSVGHFTTKVLDINPGYTLTDFPGDWTKYTVTIEGMPVARKTRVAFRYYVPNGGPGGTNGLGVGIDQFMFTSN